jgi:hypothetical protein
MLNRLGRKTSELSKEEKTMDTNVLLIVALFAVIVVAVLLVFRSKLKLGIEALGAKLKIDASNQEESNPGVNLEKVKSRKGGILAEDQTGRGTSIVDAEVEQDIIASSTPPPPEKRRK